MEAAMQIRRNCCQRQEKLESRKMKQMEKIKAKRRKRT